MSKDDVPFFSIVIPVYNEESNIEYLYDSIKRELIGLHYELIYIDDGSSDNSSKLIKDIVEKDKDAIAIILSRNFGHQAALKAGIDITKGEFVITMDGDGQNPPDLIHEMIELYHQGYDIISARRKFEKNKHFLKRISSKLFYFIFNKLSEIKIPKYSSDFRLMSRKSIDAYLELSENIRFNRGLSAWIGFNQISIEFIPNKRHKGESKFSSRQLFSLGIDAITSFSSMPLRLSFLFGLIVSFFGVVYGIYAIVMYFQDNVVKGWTSLIVLILIIGGIQLISIGLVGEYLAKIFYETKKRPIYIVKEIIK